MKQILVSFADFKFIESQQRLIRSANIFGLNNIVSYSFADIKKSSFYEINKDILDNPRGKGYWLWKPYIILETINRAEDGDIIIYCDSGIEIIASLDPLLSICDTKEDILLFENNTFINAQWTKRDCFVLMNCDNESYWNGVHCDAAFLMLKKSGKSIKFVNEWLYYSSNKYIITDLPNSCGKENHSQFIDHRHDQSIISILAHKYCISLYRMPTQFGNHYKIPEYRIKNEFNCISQSNRNQVDFYSSNPLINSPYGQLLNHHRSQEKQNLFQLVYSKMFH